MEKQACDKVEAKVEIGKGLAVDTVVFSPCTSRTRRSQPALATSEMAVMSEELFGHQLVAGGIDYDVEKANATISQLQPCRKRNMDGDGRTPKSILKRNRQVVAWVDDFTHILIVHCSALYGREKL